jgi:two-component system OmpR family sensor kinase/two-component system sensor histidine kinase BaeS
LILAFMLVAAVAILSVTLVARWGAQREVRAFMVHGSMAELEGLAADLETYYAANGSWRGVQAVLGGAGTQGRGRGMMGGAGMMSGAQTLRVSDAAGRAVAALGIGLVDLSAAERAAAVPLVVDGQRVGYLLAEGGIAVTTGEGQLVSRLTQAALVGGALAGALALGLALLLAARLTRPLEALASAAARLGGGDLSPRVAPQGGAEIAAVGQAFNQMADSLQALEQSRRALTADIAHELRTPLAVQRAALEALQDGVYPLSAENLQPVLDANLLLTRLVQDLGTLALADAGQLALDRAPVSLPALVRRVLEGFGPPAAAAGVTLELEAAALPPLLLDEGRITQILTNLIANALRYTPSGGVIRLTLGRAAAAIQLAVADSGPGIAPDALPHLFERFYRGDSGRSRAEGGTGLGLAIARRLAEAHGGTLTAANRSSGGAVFILTLPEDARDAEK